MQYVSCIVNTKGITIPTFFNHIIHPYMNSGTIKEMRLKPPPRGSILIPNVIETWRRVYQTSVADVPAPQTQTDCGQYWIVTYE